MLGIRMCNLDDQGIDALAATCVLAGDQGKTKLCIDCNMNRGADENATETLSKGHHQDYVLEGMAERHFDAIEAAKEREARRNAESHMNDFFSIHEDVSDDDFDLYDKDHYNFY